MKISPEPIRFADDVNVSSLWKISECLIDFGGKGRKITAVNSKANNVLYTSDPAKKHSLFFASVMKVAALALIYLTVVGAIAHIGIVVYNRSKHHFVNTPPNFIDDLKYIVSTVSMQKVEGYNDVLFDGKSDENVDQEKINFMENLPLAQIEFDNLDGNPNFIIRNNMTNEELEFSNREPSKGEIRGRVLRDLLDKYKMIDPNQSLYTAISKIITSKDSDIYKMFKRGLSEDIMSLCIDEIVDDFFPL
jgi:hypothetical protein